MRTGVPLARKCPATIQDHVETLLAHRPARPGVCECAAAKDPRSGDAVRFGVPTRRKVTNSSHFVPGSPTTRAPRSLVVDLTALSRQRAGTFHIEAMACSARESVVELPGSLEDAPCLHALTGRWGGREQLGRHESSRPDQRAALYRELGCIGCRHRAAFRGGSVPSGARARRIDADVRPARAIVETTCDDCSRSGLRCAD